MSQKAVICSQSTSEHFVEARFISNWSLYCKLLLGRFLFLLLGFFVAAVRKKQHARKRQHD
jgi:hypothetical protein